jgi:anthranilate phosphoribosyltransferase
MLEVMAMVLGQRGASHVLVVRGEDGLDELTTCDRTRLVELRADRSGDLSIEESWIDPSAHGFERCGLEALQGGDAAHNAAIARRLLDGEEGPVRDVVVLNAGAALVAADVADTIDDGIRIAGDALASGSARRVLASVVAFSASR